MANSRYDILKAFSSLIILCLSLTQFGCGGGGSGGGGSGGGSAGSTTGIETVLYSFSGPGADGENPASVLIKDASGNLYGTTVNGGAFSLGTVFKLTPSGTETVLHSFSGSGTDGAYPEAGLVMDASGNLYGTTLNGGTYGAGTVFKLTPSGTETVLHSFAGTSTDEGYPQAGLVMDASGNLYGTASDANGVNMGTVFKITPTGTITVLHSFTGTDGETPAADLVMDTSGNLYGTTANGGTYGYGTVFKLTPSGTETVLHSFSSTEGHPSLSTAGPGLVIDASGNLYGTAGIGGANGGGTVFKLTPTGTITVLHSFSGAAGSSDGGFPAGGLIMDASGNLYGATAAGGTTSAGNFIDHGTVFKITPTGAETLLYTFGPTPDGYEPLAGLVMDASCNLYGTTGYGGTHDYGTVFKISSGSSSSSCGSTSTISATATTTAQNLRVGMAMTSFSPLTPSGGATPYTYNISSGTLPAGLSFSNGVVSGTPTATQVSANVIFSVQDANGVVASTTSSVSFSVAMLPAGYVTEGGLTWMPASSTTYVYSSAVALCSGSILGQTGWRLPTITELTGLTASQIGSGTVTATGGLYGSGAMNGQGWTLNNDMWSSTPYTAIGQYVVDLATGSTSNYVNSVYFLVTCVH